MNIVYLVNVSCVLENIMHSLLLAEAFYKCQLGLWLKSSICLLIICWLILLIAEKWVLKSPAIIVDLCLYTFNSICFCFVYLEVLLLGIQINYRCYILLMNQLLHHYEMTLFTLMIIFALKSTLYINIATPTFFWLMLAQHIFFPFF